MHHCIALKKEFRHIFLKIIWVGLQAFGGEKIARANLKSEEERTKGRLDIFLKQKKITRNWGGRGGICSELLGGF